MNKADTPSGLPDIVPIDINGLDEWREKIKNGTLPFADGRQGNQVKPNKQITMFEKVSPCHPDTATMIA